MKRVTSIIMVLAMLVSLIPVNVSADGLQEEPSQEVVQQEHSEQQSEEALEADSQEQTPEEEPEEGSQEPLPEEDLEQIPEEDLEEESQVSEKEPEVPAILTWEEYCYTLLADESVSICGFEGAPENEEEPFRVEIPSKINGSKVTEIAEKAFAGNGEIEGVLLPETIQTIGRGAFEDCGNLKVIGFCGKIPSFGDSLAKGANRLDTILNLEKNDYTELSNLLKQDLGDLRASNVQFLSFENITALKNFAQTVGENPGSQDKDLLDDNGIVATGAEDGDNDLPVPFVENSVDQGSGNLVAAGTCGVALNWMLDDQGILTISGSGDMYDFDYNESPWYYDLRIKEVILEDGVTSIGENAFWACENLQQVSIPDSVLLIGNDAFLDCANLQEVAIPQSVESIAYGAFSRCSRLKAVSVHPGNQKYCDIDGIVYSKDRTEMVMCPGGKSGAVAVPEGVKVISDSAFNYCSNVNSVLLPESVNKIGDHAFYYCSSLKEIIIPDGVTQIGDLAFFGCSGLLNITLPNSVVEIGNSTFANCSGLLSVELPEDTVGITSNMFRDCFNLKEIEIPSSAQYIDDRAFQGCTSLTSITIPAGVDRLLGYIFAECNNLESIYFEGDAPDFEENTFQDFGATVFYPPDNETWTEEVFQNYGGMIEWKINEGDSVHKHSYSTVVTPPTCTERGYTTYTCFCGHSYVDDYVDAVGHSYGEWYETKAPTQDTEGEERRDCVNCDNYETRAIAREKVGGVCGESLTWELDETGTLIIAGIGAMTEFSSYSDVPWYKYRGKILDLIVEENVTSISNYAFYQCTALQKISLNAKTLNDLSHGNCVFYEAGTESSGIEVVIGANTTKVPAELFCNNLHEPNIKKVVFAEGSVCESIGKYAFAYCTALTDAILPESLDSIGESAFRGCTQLNNVSAPKMAITNIGRYVFNGCSSLSSIVISGNVGESAFRDCSSLAKVELTDSVSSIDSYAFRDCSSLTKVELTDSVSSIGSYAFQNCANISRFSIPNSVVSIGDGVFYGCTGLTTAGPIGSGCNIEFGWEDAIPDYAFSWHDSLSSVEVPDTVTAIGKQAFCGTGLRNIELPDGITSIGISAFLNCTDLTRITIPETMVTLSGSAFEGCTAVEKIYFNAKAMDDLDSPNYVFDSVGKNSSGVTVIVGANVTRIPGNLFCPAMDFNNIGYNPNITNVVFEEQSVCTSIGDFAFAFCGEINGFMMPKSLTSIERWAFYRSSVKCLHIDDIAAWCGVTFNGNYSNPLTTSVDVYVGGVLVTDLVIPEGVTSIGRATFQNCKGLKSVTIPSSVAYIGDSAFSNCTALTKINYYATAMEDGTTALSGVFCMAGTEENGITVTVGANVTKIPAYLFSTDYIHDDGPNIKNVVFENGSICRSIGEHAFAYCSTLTDITIPNSVTSVGNRAFYHCSSLTSVIIPDGVKRINEDVFAGCTNLRSVEIPEGVSEIGAGAFSGCSSLNSVEIPESVYRIDYYAFYGCSSLKSVMIPAGITYINYAFNGCNGLKGIWVEENNRRYCNDTLGVLFNKEMTELIQAPALLSGEYRVPDSVTSFDSYAFSDCSNLSSVIIPNSVEKIDYRVFSGCVNLEQVTLPNSVTNIDDYAFSNCSNLSDVYYSGSEEEWKSITIGLDNEYLINAAIHYDNAAQNNFVNVCYFYKWDAENQIAYFDTDPDVDILNFGCQVTEETDPSFLDHLDQLVGKYVLVEFKDRTDDLIGPDTLIRIQPVETRVGTVSASDGHTMTIDGKDYAVPEDLTLPMVYVNARVLYHFDDNGLQGIERLSVKKGTLSGWDAQTQEMAIRPENGYSPSLYTLSPLADEETVAYLRSYFSGACRSVCYYFDDNKFVYRIVEGPPSYNVPPEYVKPDPLQDYLVSYQNEWETAYRNLMDAVKQALDEFAGNPEVEKQDAIAAEALRMKTHDDASFSKYISGTLGPYEDVAYQALAQYFYEEISQYSIPDLSSIDLSGSMAGTQIVNNVLKNIGGESKEYTIDGIHIQIVPAILGMGTGFGKMVIDENTTVIFCSTQDQCREIIGEYLKELQDLTTNSTYNVVSAVYKDLLGKPISSLTKEYVTQVANKIEKKLAVSLAEKFNLAGAGDLFQTLDTCYTYYTWAQKAVNTANTDDIQAAVNNIMNLNFEDTSIKNAAVKSAMKKLNSASSKLTRAFNEYLDGTIEEKENSFWRLLFGCPVNISVFNSSGEQIGYISDDDIWYTSAVKINRLGSAKEIIVLDHDTPSFVISATDYGEMSCSFEEYDSNFLPIGRLNYYSIPLTPGQDFSVTLVDNLEAHAEELAIESNGELIYPDEYIPVTQNAAVSISCNFEGIDEGTVYGTGVYVCGEAVLLSAVPQDGYQFVGWYDDGNLVCESPSYEFTARTDKTLTAKFCEKTESVQIDVIYDEGGFAMGGGTYSKNREVALLAIPYDAYSFTGWYRDGQLVSGSAEYSIHCRYGCHIGSQICKA